MNVLKTLNENKFNDIFMDVDTVEVITPCTLRIRSFSMKYKIKNNDAFNKLPFRCVLKSNRNNSIVRLDDILSLKVTAVYDECRVTGAYDSSIKINKGSICILDLMHPLSTEQMANLISQTDSLSYNKKFFNLE